MRQSTRSKGIIKHSNSLPVDGLRSPEIQAFTLPAT